MKVEEIKEYSSTVLDILQSLLPQLSKNAAIPTEELARRIVESNATRLLVAEEGGVVLGMLTIVIFPIPSGVRAWIEDVVVDEAGRGKGVGEALRAGDKIKSHFCSSMHLTPLRCSSVEYPAIRPPLALLGERLNNQKCDFILSPALSNHALQLARSEGARTVDLTSRPSREAANRLYKRIGFMPRETNVYRFDVES